MVWKRLSLKNFWKEEFGTGEPDFTRWLLGEDLRPPIGRPARIRAEIERATDTYLWNLEAEKSYRENAFKMDGAGRGFHRDQYANVVIEVQFENDKEHTADHLGRLLAYAHLEDADVVIWITPRTLAGKQVFPGTMSYLHENSDVDFYHLYIEVVRSGEGIVDVDVDNVYGSPESAGTVEGDFLSGQQEKFWLMLSDPARSPLAHTSTPGPGSHFPCGGAVDIAGVDPEFRIDSVSEHVKFRVRFSGERAVETYRSLKHRPTPFADGLLGAVEVSWLDGPSRQVPVLEIARADFSIDDQTLWASQIQWLYRALNVFRKLV